jgi:sirohydrochlorin ferrochelatase
MSQPPSNHAILASHGTDDPIGAGLIHALVTAVAATLPEVQIHETFVDVQHPQITDVLPRAVAAGEAAEPGATFTIVPLLLSTGYHVRQDITDAVLAAKANSPAAIAVTPALGPSSELIDLLYLRLRETGWTPEDIAVLAVAGSSDEAAVDECRLVHAILRDAIQSQYPNAVVELAFLSAVEPKLKDLVPKIKFQNPRKRVVVANYLLAPGFFDGLARRSGAHLVAQPLLAPDQPPAQQLIDLIVRRIGEATDANPGKAAEGQLGCSKPASADWSCALGCGAPCRS